MYVSNHARLCCMTARLDSGFDGPWPTPSKLTRCMESSFEEREHTTGLARLLPRLHGGNAILLLGGFPRIRKLVFVVAAATPPPTRCSPRQQRPAGQYAARRRRTAQSE